MNISELAKLSDEEKIEYLKNHNTELSEATKLDILKDIKNNDLRKKCVMDNPGNLGLKSKINFLIYLDRFNIFPNDENTSDFILGLYQKWLAESNDNERLECVNDQSDDQLDDDFKVVIIKSMEDTQLKIRCLENPDIQFHPFNIADIISSINNEQMKIDYLENPDMNFSSENKTKILQSLENEQMKIDYLENPDMKLTAKDKLNIIDSINNNQIKIGYLENFDIETFISNDTDDLTNSITDLDTSFKTEIINSLTDEQLRIACLTNENINTDSSVKSNVINSLIDEKLRITCLTDQTIALDPFAKSRVISLLTDEQIKLHYIQDSHIDFSEQDKLLMICSLQDNQKFEKFALLPDASYKKGLDLPPNMTIGIELEAEGTYAESLKNISETLNGWESKADLSLQNGVEVVSPILHSTEDDMYSLATVCNIMQKLDLNTSERCGGHIHFGTDFLGNDYNSWKNFLTIYNECEEIFYKMSNATSQVPRDNISINAMISSNDLSTIFENGEVCIETQEDFDKTIKPLQDTRQRGINLTNIYKNGKDTIEFRMPNGTIDVETVRENIKLFGSLLQVSKEMSLNPEYKKEEFDVLKQKDLTEKEKVEALLDLLFDDEQEQSIYRERWDSVKNHVIFERLKSETPTFKRRDYSMKNQIAGQIVDEVRPEDRQEFVHEIKEDISHEKDKSAEDILK